MSIEDQITRLDQALSDAEKQAVAILGRVRGLRKRAAAGDLAQAAPSFDAVPAQLEQFSGAVERARATLTYDAAAALADGSYLAELKVHAAAENLVLNDIDGRLTAFPLLLKLEPRSAGVRVGRKLLKTLRPSVLVKLLQKAQVSSRFDAGRFLGQVFKGYERLAPLARPDWKPDRPGAGPVVALNDIYEVLTLLPVAASEYSRDAFATDLLRLDGAPDTVTAKGHRFTLPASTGSKGRDRMTVYDESGAERVFVGVQFSLGAGSGDGA